MDATTPQRGDDDQPPAQPAVPPASDDSASDGGSTAVGASSPPAAGHTAAPVAETAPEAAAEAPGARSADAAPGAPAVVDDGPEDPTVPDAAVEAAVTSRTAGSSPDEPVVPTAQPDEVALTEADEPHRSERTDEFDDAGTDDTASHSAPVPAAAHVAAASRAGDAPQQSAPEHTESAAHTESAVPAREVVYVAAPNPPKKKGNRGVGALIAAVSAFVFLFFYALIALLIRAVMTGDTRIDFLSDQSFYIPVLLFTVAFILLALVVNRAGWWSFVLGSLFVGLFVYFGTIGVLLLRDAASLTPAAANTEFRNYLVNPLVVAAGLVAREVALWVGAGISARGRRVKARNAEARAEYEREQAERQAEIERNGAVVRHA